MMKHLTIALFAASLSVGAFACKKKTEEAPVTANKPEEIREAQEDVRERAQEARNDAKDAREEAREHQQEANQAAGEAREKTQEAAQLEQLSYQLTGVEQCDKYLERVKKCDKLSAEDRKVFLSTIDSHRKTMMAKGDDAEKRVKDACDAADDAWENMLKAHGC